jgi:xylulokinase
VTGPDLVCGLDIGTSSSKAVLVDLDGEVVASAAVEHRTEIPRPGFFEHDPERTWWAGVRSLLASLAPQLSSVRGVCVSGIGPVVLLTDADGRPLRPAILYGIDTRAEREIVELTERLGADRVAEVAGNPLTTQAVGPKLAWVRRHEREVWARSRRWFQASSWVVHRLTGEYVVDRYSASAADPMYALEERDWWEDAWRECAPGLARPRLLWPGERAGVLDNRMAAELGLPPGIPVLSGTIDALAEAYSVGVREPGDVMLMYGSTMFFIQHTAGRVRHEGLWTNTALAAAGYSCAAGMATSGLVTNWLRELTGADYPTLLDEAAAVPPGSDGLVLLPYFAGERTPIADPSASGVWIGLTLRHGRGHLYRSALEGVGYGVRHNLAAMASAGAPPRRLLAVGGGTTGALWTQIVSDVSGYPQDIPTLNVGACYGDARLAADALGVDTANWNPVRERREPRPEHRDRYDELFQVYRNGYQALRPELHRLARLRAHGSGTSAR